MTRACGGRPTRCLVVGDSALTRRILVDTLRTLGFEHVCEATDGAQALRGVGGPVDFVVADWNRPGLGGARLVRELRTNLAFAEIPILLMTPREVRDLPTEAAGSGIDGRLSKPFTPETLRAGIEALLGAAASEDGTGTDG